MSFGFFSLLVSGFRARTAEGHCEDGEDYRRFSTSL